MRKSITSGVKVSNSHQSIIVDAIPILRKLKEEDYIEKIVIGKIKRVSSKKEKLLQEDTGTSIRLVVKGKGEIQEFYTIGSNLGRINRRIKQMASQWR